MLIISTETIYNDDNNNNNKNPKTMTKTATLRKGENWISRVTTLLDLSVQFNNKKIYKAYKEMEKHGPFKGRKIIQ